MAENSKKEKFLIPLKNICSQIVAEPQKCSQYIKDLWAYTEKGEFYKFYVFVLSLETITDNPELPSKAAEDFLKLIEKLLNEGLDNKDAIFSRLYNFVKLKNRLDIIDRLVPICCFKVDPILSNKTYLFLMSEILFKSTTTTENRQAMVKNFRNHISNYSQDKDLNEKLFQSVYRITYNFICEKNWSEALNFLKNTIVCSAVNGTLKIPSDEAYDGILNMLMILVKYSRENTDVFQLCLDMTTNVSSLLIDKTQQTCNSVLVKMFTMCCDGKISNDGIKKLFLSHYNKVDPQGVLLEKTALLIGKVLEYNIRMFEVSSEFFNTYHFFIVKLFNALKSIKNKDGVVSCCDDIKRHSVIELSRTIISLAIELVKTTKINETFAENLSEKLLYHVTFLASLIKGLKCQSKHKKTVQIYEAVHYLLYDIVTQKLIGNKLQHISQCANIMMKFWDDLPETVKLSNSDPELLALIIYENPSNEENAKICANEIASIIVKHPDLPVYLDSSKEQKKKLMKLMSVLTQSTKLLKHASATEYLQKKYSKTCGAYLAIFALIEMTAVKRYNPEPDNELIAELFSKLCNLTMCPLTLAQACQSVGDEVVKKIPSNLFKRVNKLLEAEEKKQFNLQISLSLALNNYSIFFTKAEKIESNFKADDETFEGLNLNEELEILKNLNDSLRYFTDVVAHLISNKDDIDQIMSIKSLTGIINNLAFQFYVRGIKYKDLEAFTLLWHVSLMEGNQKLSILSVATFFLDNHKLLTDSSGNYVKFSKKIKPLSIEEILDETNALIDGLFLINFNGETPNTQCSVWSYLLSLWAYYLRQGRKSDGQKRWNQFKTTWSSTNFTDEFSRREVIKAKVYFCVVEISMKCYQRSADNFLGLGVSLLVSANKIAREFVYIFYQIFNHIAIEAINYSLNRLADMTHYNAVMEKMITSAAKKKFCFKVINLLSLSIIRNLNMEKIDRAKTLLKEITKILGVKEEILVESSPKAMMPTAAIHYELFNEQVRKVELSSDSPLKSELSMVYQDQSIQLIKQLISFIHKENCECNICKVPQLKFIMFQIGCHYSRLMWIMNKFEVSRIFNEYALDPWRNTCDKLRRLKHCETFAVDKIDFAVFSIRWLFQIADTLVKLRMFEEIEEIYQEVELICTTNIPDYDCFKETLHVRKENLNFLIENRSEELADKDKSELSFSVFIETRGKSTKDFSTPELMIHREIQQKPLDLGSSDVIYIDSDDGDKNASSKPAPKTTKKNLSQAVKQSSKTPKTRAEPTPKTASKPATRKTKVSVNVETPVTSTRKTRRMF